MTPACETLLDPAFPEGYDEKINVKDKESPKNGNDLLCPTIKCTKSGFKSRDEQSLNKHRKSVHKCPILSCTLVSTEY